ncbi:MAG: DNA-3-methyladenine glycosylase [Clostridiales bacterium]|nr:DNA-3-methyladenine glycosylase [Clostridiales bacterium]
MKLTSEQYSRQAEELAPFLIGKLLCRKLPSGDIIKLRITETECYCGERDTACHAHKGRTPRTETLYRQGGTVYVYLCYGIHNLMNVISGSEGEAQGVLLRAVEGTYGPGRLTKLLEIDRRLNGADLASSDEIWIEDDGVDFEYELGTRIGINYASNEDKNRLWRFTAKNL